MPKQDGPIDFPDLCALKAGDLQAWRAVWPSLWPIALHATRRTSGLLHWEAEDIASEAIEELILRIDTTLSVQHAKALLATIASRRAIDFARRKSAEKRRLPSPEQCEALLPTPTGHLSNLDQPEMVMLVHQALEVLDADARLLLMQKIGQQLTYREISLLHDIPIGTVCTKVARSLVKIQDALHQSPTLVKEMRSFLR